MATVDSRGVGSCLFEIGVNPENDRTTGNTETVGQGSLETLSQRRKELSVFKRFHPIVYGYARLCSRYREPSVRVHTGTVNMGFLAKFEARRASESVLRVPGQSSGCALTARNPAAFSPSPVSVARQRRQETDPCLKELQWDCDGNPRLPSSAISPRQIFLSNVARSRRD